MTQGRPLRLSVIVCAHNEALFLAPCLHSLLAQTRLPDEILVINNASTDHREELADLVDVWEAANRDDLFSVTSLKHYPYVANSDFHKPRHLYSWKTLVRSDKNWPAIRQALRANVDIALTLFRKESWAA